MYMIASDRLLEMTVFPLFVALCILTVKELKSSRYYFTVRSYVYFSLLAIYLVIVWNIVPTGLNWLDI